MRLNTAFLDLVALSSAKNAEQRGLAMKRLPIRIA